MTTSRRQGVSAPQSPFITIFLFGFWLMVSGVAAIALWVILGAAGSFVAKLVIFPVALVF